MSLVFALQVATVEVELSLLDSGSGSSFLLLRKSLAPHNSTGDTVSQRVLRLSTLSNRYQINGRVFFTDGSVAPLKSRDETSNVLSLTIDHIVFPEDLNR
jgi:hypothetical protein